MSIELVRNRWIRKTLAVLAGLIIAITASITLAGPAGGAAPTKPTCAAGATPVLYREQWYCPGTAIGVMNTAYGSGRRILLAGVSVTAISGANATVSSTTVTPCPPGKYCGAIVTVTTVTVSLSGLITRPVVGDFGDFYGVTGAAKLNANWFVKQSGGGGCTNPDFC